LILDASSLYIILKRGNLKALENSVTLDLAFYEIGNAMLKELKRKLITPQSFAKALSALVSMNEMITVKKFGELDARRVAEVSRSTGLTFYDASYLTLAVMLNETLATHDKELADESRKVGIRVVPE
jgi:predicted nucleic acid-binding protein